MEIISKLMDNAINKLQGLKMAAALNEIVIVNKEPYFRKMKVESGWLYNFYDIEKDEYRPDWIYVPDTNERLKQLEHYEASTLGLYATDKPELVSDPHNVLFQIKSQFDKYFEKVR